MVAEVSEKLPLLDRSALQTTERYCRLAGVRTGTPVLRISCSKYRSSFFFSGLAFPSNNGSILTATATERNRGSAYVCPLVSRSRPVHPGLKTRFARLARTVPTARSDARQTNAWRHSSTPQEGAQPSADLKPSLRESQFRKESHKNRFGRASSHPSSA